MVSQHVAQATVSGSASTPVTVAMLGEPTVSGAHHPVAGSPLPRLIPPCTRAPGLPSLRWVVERVVGVR